MFTNTNFFFLLLLLHTYSYEISGENNGLNKFEAFRRQELLKSLFKKILHNENDFDESHFKSKTLNPSVNTDLTKVCWENCDGNQTNMKVILMRKFEQLSRQNGSYTGGDNNILMQRRRSNKKETNRPRIKDKIKTNRRNYKRPFLSECYEM